MSANITRTGRLREQLATRRHAALLGISVFTGTYVSVLYHVTDVVGGAERFLVVVVTALLLATLAGATVETRTAGAITAALVVIGIGVYILALPAEQRSLLTISRVIGDTLLLLSGLSVLRLVRAGVWAMAIAPAPVFFSWYLAMRGRYVASVGVGSIALGVVILTGDAGLFVTLIGVVSAMVAVGIGTLPERGSITPQIETLAMVLAVMIVLSATLSVVPGTGANPGGGSGGSGGDGASTMEASLIASQDQVQVQGSIRLSPKVRFTVQSGKPAYWQVAAYDRYTGEGWVRTGQATPYRRPLAGPPGPSRGLQQIITVQTDMRTMPAAWKPVWVDDDHASQVQVLPQGNLRPDETLHQGETYVVESRMPVYTEQGLRSAGTDYPDRVSERYLQLPETTSDRVREKATEIAGNRSTPYDKARAIEAYLEANKEYSLQVERPSGDVADAFLFEMDKGYCVYYATTMVVLLRAQGIPARFVTGYTTGQQVSQGEWVVRGLNSHAWVEVYFPDVGWVRFDPTPAAARQRAENDRLEQARNQGVENVDTDDSAGGEIATPTPTPTRNQTNGSGDLLEQDREVNDTGLQERLNDSIATPAANGSSGTEGGGWRVPSPSRRTLGLGLIALIGFAAGVRRTGFDRRVRALAHRYYQLPGDAPEADVRRAFDRLEPWLGKQYRPRRPSETPREYMTTLERQGLDERAQTVGQLYEQAQYGHGVTAEEAATAVWYVNGLLWERVPVARRVLGWGRSVRDRWKSVRDQWNAVRNRWN